MNWTRHESKKAKNLMEAKKTLAVPDYFETLDAKQDIVLIRYADLSEGRDVLHPEFWDQNGLKVVTERDDRIAYGAQKAAAELKIPITFGRLERHEIRHAVYQDLSPAEKELLKTFLQIGEAKLPQKWKAAFRRE